MIKDPPSSCSAGLYEGENDITHWQATILGPV